MKRALWIGIVLGYAVLAIAGPVAMVRESVLDSLGGAPAVGASAAGGADGTGAEPGPDGGATVLMKSLEFSPATLTVPKGATVLFDNQDVAPHTVTADDVGVESGVIGPGRSFELVVDESFDYLCTIHPSMRARITVEGGRVDIIGLLNDLTGGNLLLWKVVGATIVLFLAGLQVLLAARFWRVTPVPPLRVGSAATAHRLLGRIALLVAVLIAISCVVGPAGPTSPTRVLLHSVFGSLVFVILVVKFFLLRVLRKGSSMLPFLGSSLFLSFGVIWATSVADYVAAR